MVSMVMHDEHGNLLPETDGTTIMAAAVAAMTSAAVERTVNTIARARLEPMGALETFLHTRLDGEAMRTALRLLEGIDDALDVPLHALSGV